MKPRFSILALLLVIAYIGVVLGAIQQPESEWTTAATLSWFAVAGLLLAHAFAMKGGSNTVFGRAATAFLLLYLFVGLSQRSEATPWSILPHQRLAEWWLTSQNELVQSAPPSAAASGTRRTSDLFRARQRVAMELQHLDTIRHGIIEPIATLNCALLFGLFGGYLALWRYRVLERREQQHKSD